MSKPDSTVAQFNLNTILLSIIVPLLAYNCLQTHALDVRVARVEQHLIDSTARVDKVP